jgi:tRNA-splicing ligase RtcB
MRGCLSGGVGFDINCGVRALATNISEEDFMNKRKEVLHDIFRSVPSGVGRGRAKKLTNEELDEVLSKGADWAIEKGFGIKEDLERSEENGRMRDANPKDVSQRAKARGKDQVGTLGAGNHFLEIQRLKKFSMKMLLSRLDLNKEKLL